MAPSTVNLPSPIARMRAAISPDATNWLALVML
jgi:hypothetical protein